MASGQSPLRDERIQALEQAVRFYVHQCHRLEGRAQAAELQRDAYRAKLEAAGIPVDDWFAEWAPDRD